MPSAKSTKAPAFQFYPKDFLADSNVDEMSMAERGMYITLLCKCWLDGGLPIDLPALARMVRTRPDMFSKVWPSGLSKCFVERSGKLQNPRLLKEQKKQDEYRARQADNGSKGGRPPRNPLVPKQKAVGSEKVTHAEPKESSSSPISDLQSSTPVNTDESFEAFVLAYPEHRRSRSILVQQAFVMAVLEAGNASVLFTALALYVASEDWRDPKFVLGMERWLLDKKWRDKPEPRKAPAGRGVTGAAPKGKYDHLVISDEQTSH